MESYPLLQRGRSVRSVSRPFTSSTTIAHGPQGRPGRRRSSWYAKCTRTNRQRDRMRYIAVQQTSAVTAADAVSLQTDLLASCSSTQLGKLLESLKSYQSCTKMLSYPRNNGPETPCPSTMEASRPPHVRRSEAIAQCNVPFRRRVELARGALPSSHERGQDARDIGRSLSHNWHRHCTDLTRSRSI